MHKSRQKHTKALKRTKHDRQSLKPIAKSTKSKCLTQNMRSLKTTPTSLTKNNQLRKKSHTLLSSSIRCVTYHPPGEPQDGETYQAITSKLITNVPNLIHYEVINESNQHSGPPHRESHFKITAVAPWLKNNNDINSGKMMLVGRHRFVNTILQDEIANGVHALSLHLFTQDEFEKTNGAVPISPGCTSKNSKANV